MLEHILKDDPVYRQLKDEIEDYCGPVLVSGCTDTAKWHLTSLIGNHKKKQFKIIIVPDESKTMGRGKSFLWRKGSVYSSKRSIILYSRCSWKCNRKRPYAGDQEDRG